MKPLIFRGITVAVAGLQALLSSFAPLAAQTVSMLTPSPTIAGQASFPLIIPFSPRSAALNFESAGNQLDELAHSYSAGTPFSVLIDAFYFSGAGSNAVGLNLSRSRTKAVQQYLVKRGIPDAAIFIQLRHERLPGGSSPPPMQIVTIDVAPPPNEFTLPSPVRAWPTGTTSLPDLGSRQRR